MNYELMYKGLLERVGERTKQYENEVAGLRVNLTEAFERIEELEKHVQETQASNGED